jgi:pimeloyl-ACP methyl ester carboxylesterase
VPRVKLEIASPDEVAAIYDAALADMSLFTSPPDAQPDIQVSHPIDTAGGRDLWLRFRSPSRRVGDIVTARVHEPLGVSDPPTIIFGHGICVEFDHWQGLIDECEALVRMGFRVIRPEAPWHGRRRREGEFGGEHVISAFPLGALDAVFAAVQEWAVLARWARQTSGGPLAFGGTSLGAMTSQFAADRANDWPKELRPDALLLLTHTENLTHAVMTGALADLWMSRADAEAKGWSEDLARRYLRLLEPVRPLCVPPAQIVSVLGRRDVVLPFAGGRRLVEAWCVPHDNVFIWDRGHFSVPMTMAGNHAPLRRFAAIVSALRR